MGSHRVGDNCETFNSIQFLKGHLKSFVFKGIPIWVWKQPQICLFHSHRSKFIKIKILKWSESHSVLSDSLWSYGLYNPWNSPGKNTRVGSLSLLQGIFPTQRSNPGLLHCRQILYQLSHKGSPRILERIAYPFSSRSSQLRNQTRLSCIASRFFTNWAIRETPKS